MPASHRGRAFGVVVFPVLVLAVALTGTLVVHRQLNAADEASVAAEVSRRTALSADAVEAEVRRYHDLVAGVAASWTDRDVRPEAFAALVDRLELADRYAGVAGFVYVERVDDEALLGASRRVRAADPGAALSGLAPGDEHFIVTAGRGPDGRPANLGADLAGAPEPAAALRIARDRGEITLSKAYRLLRDRSLPRDEQQLSFVMAAPVYTAGLPTGTVGERRAALRGWVAASLRGTSFFTAVTARPGEGLGLRLIEHAHSLPGAPGTPVAVVGPSSDGAALSEERMLGVPGSSWHLTATASPGLVHTLDSSAPTVALVAGLALSLLLTALAGVLATSRRRALDLVDERTAALAAANAELEAANGELTTFAGLAAHDLRNPMTAVLFCADELLDRCRTAPWSPEAEPLRADAAVLLQRITRTGQRTLDLLDDLLAWATSRDAPLDRAPLPLGEVVAHVLDERAHAFADLDAVVTVGPLPTVDADRRFVQQVIDNLVGNALKYVTPGGVPDIEVAARRSADGWWRIEVADRGLGVPAAARVTLFDPFTRAHAGIPGTGLGLAMCARVVTRHGGRIGVDPRDGGGSVFWFTLPQVSVVAGPPSDAVRATPPVTVGS